MRGLLIGAPASGCGKTTITLGLIRALKNAGHKVVSAKVGPDYIDPKFHQVASSSHCFTLDPWAMRTQTLHTLADTLAQTGDLLIVEGMMGLFDGARDGSGTSADLAAVFGLPVILVIDAVAQSHSVAAVAQGFANHRQDCQITGIILNRVGSSTHEKMLRDALAPTHIPVVGALPRDPAFSLPSRHLGLVQAGEHKDIEGFIEQLANIIANNLDLELLVDRAKPVQEDHDPSPYVPLPPLGQKIAVARDIAFEFTYPHCMQSWRRAGAEITFFSPLADQAPAPDSDAIFLPGGYPELHAGRLAGNQAFLNGLRQAAKSRVLIYGECGGYMVLGKVLTDEHERDHVMAGLLPVHTSFAQRRLHLGYRKLDPCMDGTPWSQVVSAHEFHYASIITQDKSGPLFDAVDATGNPLGTIGHRCGTVMGSFAHIIDYCPGVS